MAGHPGTSASLGSGPPAPAGCELRLVPSKGYGLFATAPLTQNVTCHSEEPLFAMQHTGNRRVVGACARCSGVIGSLETQLQVIFSEARFAPLLASLGEAVPAWQTELTAGWPQATGSCGTRGAAIRCAHGCGEVYCSEECRDAHWAHSHNLLCVGTIDQEDHPLIRFKYHAIEHADTLLLAAQAFAHLINRAKAAGGGAAVMRNLISEMLVFVHAPFRDACRPPPGRAKDAEFYAHTDGLILEAANLLKAALDIHAPEESSVLFEAGPAFFSELLGTFEYNNIDIEVKSPVGAFFARRGHALLQARNMGDQRAAAELLLLENLLREKEWVLKCVWGEETTGIYGDDDAEAGMGDDAPMDDSEMVAVDEAAMVNGEMAKARAEVAKMSLEELLSAPWPTFHGIGLFASVARLNHSCAPNLKVDFLANSSCIQAVTLRPIAPGEELCISYIEQEMPVQQRRKQLLEYGFHCICERCIAEDSGAVRKKEKRLK